MSDLKIQSAFSSPLEKADPKKATPRDPLSDFKKVITDSTNEMNKILSQADQTTQEMVLGKQDIHQAMIEIEQANISLRFMLQVRNKMISAYEEIMRMQF